jgi:hypothetical protein
MFTKMYQCNKDIRVAKGKLPYWVIANHLRIHENTMMNWMKVEMNDQKKAVILNAITELNAMQIEEIS